MASHPRMTLRYDPIFPVAMLVSGVNRPESWWQEHPEFIARQVRMVKDIKRQGLKYPLSVLFLKREYQVIVGCQRLRAIRTIGMGTVPAVIASKGKPNLKLCTRKHLARLFGCKIQTFTLQPNCFEAIPADPFI